MKKIAVKKLYQGKWLSLKKSSLINNQGQTTEWEFVERPGNPAGIVIIARLVPSEQIVLLKQYRTAIDNYVIGFPAGLAYENRIDEEAIRELKEETGFQGRVTNVSPPLKSNPALINDQVYIVNAEIDENNPYNQNPVQNLEPSEEIEVLLIKEKEIPVFLRQQQEKGIEIGIGLWYAFVV